MTPPISSDSPRAQRGLTRRDVLGVAAGAGALLGAPAVLRAQPTGPKIQMGTFPVNTVLMSFNLGPPIWREEGLNMEFVKFVGGPAMVNALASGSIPAAEVGVAGALLAAIRGAPMLFFTLGSVSGKGYPFTRIMVAKDSPIRSFSDLQGKRLALHQRGTMEHLSLGAAAVRFGVPIEKISVALVPAPNQADVLAQGQVDAIYALPPFDIPAERKYGARTLVETIDCVPYLGYTTLAVHRDFVKENPDALNRMLKGWIRYSRWVDDNTAEARSVSNKYIGITGEGSDSIRIPYYTRNGLPVLPNVWHIYHMLLASKMIEPAANIKQVIDTYFVEPAQRFTMKALNEVGRQDDPVVKDFLTTKLPLLPEPAASYLAPWERT